MAGTYGGHGMRSMLKYKRDPIEWIANKVKHGLYDPKLHADMLKTHEINTLHPPLPDELRPGAKLKRADWEIKLPTDPLVEKYINRYEKKGGDKKREDEMSKILGVSNPEGNHGDFEWGLPERSVVMSNAYEFALKQLRLQTDNPEMSEEESVRAVEDLLEKEERKERMESRDKTNEIVSQKKKIPVSSEEGASSPDKEEELLKGLPSVLHSKPRTILQMSIWGDRLSQVPYHLWTLGAVTSLDHWIATQILEISDKSWKKMLRGSDLNVKSKVRDVIAVRRSLFPETMAAQSALEEDMDIVQDQDRVTTKEQKSIDELLASLVDDTDDDHDDIWKFDDDESDDEISEEEKQEVRLETFDQELQNFRHKHLENDYQEWTSESKLEFDQWIKDYVKFMASSDQEMEGVDFELTRDSLLSSPPVDRNESNAFWNHLSDETQAEIFLDKLFARGNEDNNDASDFFQQMTTKTKREFTLFSTLPYKTQVQKLVNIGTLRPLYDQYGTHEDYNKFWEDHREVLMQDVPIEALVEDRDGNITHKDIPDHYGVKKDKDGEQKRFSMKKVNYGEDSKEVEKEVQDAWSDYKASKAEHEEELFKEGKLGLKYEEEKKKGK